MTNLLTDEFRAFSAQIGGDPSQIQGAGGNTSIKDDTVMWIKASGMELADALTQDVFVAVDRQAAWREAKGDGDGTCKATVLDPKITLRPSIETTFHAALNARVVAHSHSVAVISHVISKAGRAEAATKLADLNPVFVPYAKPGLPLTKEILARVSDDTTVILLQNHGLICCGGTVAATQSTMSKVEARLARAARDTSCPPPNTPPPDGYSWATKESWMALDRRVQSLIEAGSYYPDHVVFLGPTISRETNGEAGPVILVPGKGLLLKSDATPSQRAMLRCLSDVMSRIPNDWDPLPIGPNAEAELMNWDAEKYRQALAARQ